jgi:hypothetical protein
MHGVLIRESWKQTSDGRLLDLYGQPYLLEAACILHIFDW